MHAAPLSLDRPRLLELHSAAFGATPVRAGGTCDQPRQQASRAVRRAQSVVIHSATVSRKSVAPLGLSTVHGALTNLSRPGLPVVPFFLTSRRVGGPEAVPSLRVRLASTVMIDADGEGTYHRIMSKSPNRKAVKVVLFATGCLLFLAAVVFVLQSSGSAGPVFIRAVGPTVTFAPFPIVFTLVIGALLAIGSSIAIGRKNKAKA